MAYQQGKHGVLDFANSGPYGFSNLVQYFKVLTACTWWFIMPVGDQMDYTKNHFRVAASMLPALLVLLGAGIATRPEITTARAAQLWPLDSFRAGGTATPTATIACGATWTHIASPNPGQQVNYVFGMSAVSENDIWAVGRYDDNTFCPGNYATRGQISKI